MVTRKNGYHEPQFRATFSMKQGGVASPTIFIVAVNSVFHHWILMVVEYKAVIQDGLGHTVEWVLGGGFYTDDVLLGSWDLGWVQGALNIRIGLFWKIRLSTNVAKSKTMACDPGAIRLGIS